MIFGQATYGPYGPPFKDARLQMTYLAQVNKLSASVAITEGTARDLVAAVMNSTLAAAESKVPEIEAKVRAAALAQIPIIEARVRAAALPSAEAGARQGVGKLFMGVLVVGLAGLTVYGISRAGKI